MLTVDLTPKQVSVIYAMALYPEAASKMIVGSGHNENETKQLLAELRDKLLPILPEQED